jgi:hypothetical protein
LLQLVNRAGVEVEPQSQRYSIETIVPNDCSTDNCSLCW